MSGVLNSAASAFSAQPAMTSSAKTPFRPDVPCETQDLPNLTSEVDDNVVTP
jgi:hypothetical protein